MGQYGRDLMRIKEEDTIEFLISDEAWHKGKSGKRTNTCQYLDMVDEMELLKHNIEYISLVHETTGNTFHRKLTDISEERIHDVPTYTYSWDHRKFVQKDSITLINFQN